MDRRPFAFALIVLLGLVACRSVPPLANAYGSSEALATEVLDALARRDRARLDELALSEAQFRDHVWPELPASRPERNLPFSYVWRDLRQKSDIGLTATIKRYGGQRYTLARVTFSGDTQYPHYRVRRDATFLVREPSGAEIAIRVCGSLIEKDGVWKVFSYVVDD